MISQIGKKSVKFNQLYVNYHKLCFFQTPCAAWFCDKFCVSKNFFYVLIVLLCNLASSCARCLQVLRHQAGTKKSHVNALLQKSHKTPNKLTAASFLQYNEIKLP